LVIIAEMVDAASNINLWNAIEDALAKGKNKLPKVKKEYAGIVLTFIKIQKTRFILVCRS
jgi:hypothetical protein